MFIYLRINKNGFFYFFVVFYNILIIGIEDLGEGDNVIIICFLFGLLYELSFIWFVFMLIGGGNEVVKVFIFNMILYIKMMIYNNVFKIYVFSIVFLFIFIV